MKLSTPPLVLVDWGSGSAVMDQPAPAPVAADYQHAQDGLFSAPPVALARGRQARDPQAQTVAYTVASLDAFETSLREYLDSPPEQPDHTDCQLSFWIGTSFLVGTAAPALAPQPPKHAEPKVAMSVLEALQPTPDPRDKMRKQRAIAKCCVDAIQHCDGYRYSFHNCWNSREDDSFRFSYYCNDSLLNKDRAANGKGAKLGKRATKPVYDCKGVLSIKFSATKQTLDVFYKHIPIHKTYEERAPPPRKDSRRRKFLEDNDPDALKKLQSRPKPARPEPALESPPNAKKKRKPDDQKSSTSLESDLRAQSLRSLLELIRPDPAPDHLPPEPPPPPPPAVLPQRPVPPQPPQPSVQHHSQAQPQPQPQPQPATRKRPRNSCDVCKVKKTKVGPLPLGTRSATNQNSVTERGQSARLVLIKSGSASTPSTSRTTSAAHPPSPNQQRPHEMPEPPPASFPSSNACAKNSKTQRPVSTSSKKKSAARPLPPRKHRR